MNPAKRLIRDFAWPKRLKTLATSAVAERAGSDGGVDILLLADDDPLAAANADHAADLNHTALHHENVDVLLEPELKARANQSAAGLGPHARIADPVAREASPPNAKPSNKPGFFKRLLSPRQDKDTELRRPFWRRWFYSIFFFLGMLLIWLPVLSYVAMAPPVYNSSWTIIIPGTQVGASVDLVNLGEAYTDVKTPYGGNSFSPGVNFKMIMSSSTVMSAAAEKLDMTLDDFGKPKIKVTDQAATLEVVFSSDTPESAQAKATALYEAFQDELSKLRKGEVSARRAGSFDQLEEYRVQADTARSKLALFRDTSTVVSADQYRAMVDSASKLEQSLLEARVKKDAISSRLNSMAETLGVDAYRAADVMLLRQDKLVQVLSGEYARLQALYIEQASVLGSKHPKVVHARAKANASRQSMIDRVRSVVGEVDDVLLSSYLPDPVGDDGQLYKDVVTFEAERESLIREITSTEQLLAELRGRIAVAGTDLDRLEELETTQQMAATILVSATSNLDLGRSNIYATYPLTQVLVEPTLPDRPKKLLKLLAILGGIIGSGLIILSIIVVKYRDRWRQLILKRG